MRRVLIILIATSPIVLGGCITFDNQPIEPGRYTETIPDRSDDMLRICKDKKRNRRDRNCVIKDKT